MVILIVIAIIALLMLLAMSAFVIVTLPIWIDVLVFAIIVGLIIRAIATGKQNQNNQNNGGAQ